MAAKRVWLGRVRVESVRDGERPDGRPRYRERYEYVGRYPTKRERDAAVAARKVELTAESEAAERTRDAPGESVTVREYVADVLDRMRSGALRAKSRRTFKSSSIDTAEVALGRLARDFGDRPLDGPEAISRREAIRWAEAVSEGVVASTVTLYGRAMNEELVSVSPFRGLGSRTASRADTPPPTEVEMGKLQDACSALGEYGPTMRALVTFAAFSGMRPGELFALTWEDVDLDADRVHVRRRVYKGETDLPKSNQERTIALTPPARAALLTLQQRVGLVFPSKRDRRLSQPTLSGYWSQVKARAGLDFDFYLATKHYAVHDLFVRRGLPPHVVAAQMGWSLETTTKMLAVYGHGEVGALDAIDAAFSEAVTPLRAVSDGSGEENPTHIPTLRGASWAR